MKFIDDLYNLYREHLTGDEEDAVAIVLGVMQEQDHEDMLNLVGQMSEDELFSMLSMFMIELMRQKMATEGVGNNTLETDSASDKYH